MVAEAICAVEAPPVLGRPEQDVSVVHDRGAEETTVLEAQFALLLLVSPDCVESGHERRSAHRAVVSHRAETARWPGLSFAQSPSIGPGETPTLCNSD